MPAGEITPASLEELALNLRGSWNHSADDLWARLDPELWALTHNPWAVLQTVSQDSLHQVLAEPAYRERVENLLSRRHEYLTATAWFQERHPGARLTGVAYFSMEFGLSEALPLYAGGLGNVAGDQLKAASDLGVPVMGVGLLYQQGYFRQAITAKRRQEALFTYNDPGQLPIRPVRDAKGEWVRLRIAMPGYPVVWLRAWQVQVGRVILYLLDSNDPANPPAVQAVTSELYGGGPELRLRQELVLGIGGWRLLQTLGREPEVCHLNEGHAAFAVLERARSFMEKTGQPFRASLAATRAGNLFTTHTAVPAGFDRFAPDLIAQYLRAYAEQGLRISLDELLALGRTNPRDANEPFNMAFLALRGSGAVNGVSRLHGQVSRGLFQNLFPRWPAAEVPVGHVTNGVHVPSWDSAAADELWMEACGAGRWRGELKTAERDFSSVSDGALWGMRQANRRALIEYARKRLVQQSAAAGAGESRLAEIPKWLDPEALTLGFARRFATYKRPNLLLHDRARLLRLLNDQARPVQLILAGKAHPADGWGQDMIHEWLEFIELPEANRRVVFLADYDLLLAEQLVQGVDVWINTPRRPWEASGTSGMKILVNGGLNLSELDGWWAEAYSPEVGWALGDGREHGDDPAWDTAEAEVLYGLLEREVVPAFYTRNAEGIPPAWVAKMRASMTRLTPRFSATRVVREYTERYYLPAAAAYRKRAALKGALGAQILAWHQRLAANWSEARFGALQVETEGGHHTVRVELCLGGVDPETVAVELFAAPTDGCDAVRQPMTPTRKLDGPGHAHVYSANVPASRPATDYTPRLVPSHPDALVPLEAPEILWQR
jgi:starch phosphorylase